MSTTNHTTNYELSQYIGTDVTSYLSNYNSDMYKIDAQMKVNADDAAEAKSDAATAVATSTTAASNASAAVSTANAANSTAEAAQTAATAAQTAAGAAQTTAEAALEASASNTIGNLAPAYDPTLTYAVGDLVTYVDPETNQGKLYKNIVPIDVPEQFNINKWDDVTTSEAYAAKGVIKAQISTDGVKTWADIYKYLLSSIDVYSDLTTLKMYYIDESNVIHNVFRISSGNATHIEMSNIALGSHTITMDIIQYSFSSDSILETSAVVGVGGTVTFNEGSPDSVVSGNRTFYIIQ